MIPCDSPEQAQQVARLALAHLAIFRDARVENGSDLLDNVLGQLPLVDALSFLMPDHSPIKAEQFIDDQVIEANAEEYGVCYDRKGNELPAVKICDQCGQCLHATVKDCGQCVECGTHEIGCACDADIELKVENCKCVRCMFDSNDGSDYCYVIARDIDEDGNYIDDDGNKRDGQNHEVIM